MFQITVLFVVPPLVVLLAKAKVVDNYDLMSLRSIVSGAAPLSEDIELLLNKRLGIDTVKQGYGLTETTLGIICTPIDKNKNGSSGVLVPGVTCKVCSLIQQ